MDAKDTSGHLDRQSPTPRSAWAGRILVLLLPLSSPASDRYVNVSNPTPLAPHTNWATAATVIQDAIDAASAGETVWVTNGVYATGGRIMEGSLSNRVAIDKAVLVTSVNGPESTFISGIASTNKYGLGPEAVRCVWMTNGSMLAGFTIINGHTRFLDLPDATRSPEELGGGVWCSSWLAVVSNCVIRGNGAARGGGVYNGAIVDSWMESNTVTNYGAGAYYCSLSNCTLRGGFAGRYGGGMDRCLAMECSILSNTSAMYYAGVSSSTNRGATIGWNVASLYGGGSGNSRLFGCMLVGNSASRGGGAYMGTLVNCALVGNQAVTNGGGAASSALTNCTVIGNAAVSSGGTMASTLYNTIVYYNQATTTADSNYSGGSALYSCTTPLAPGDGNIADDPGLAGVNNPRLLAGSPCIDAGANAFAMGSTDLHGKPRLAGARIDIGCDEYVSGTTVGPVAVSTFGEQTAWATGREVRFHVTTTGAVATLLWDFGDGSRATNQAAAVHVFALPGTYNIRVIAMNDDDAATGSVQIVIRSIAYYAAPWGNDVSPGTNWAGAKATIQAAIDACSPGGTVWVTNGVYNTGGRVVAGTLSNRIAVTRPIWVQSVNGPKSTFIVGHPSTNGGLGPGAMRCVWMTNGATLVGFTLTNGCTLDVKDDAPARSAEQTGGGAWGESPTALLSNCVLRGNGAGHGGGVSGGTIVDSSIAANYARYNGGGAYFSTLVDCIVVSNRASDSNGGGLAYSSATRTHIDANKSWYCGGMFASTTRCCVISRNTSVSSSGAFADSVSCGDVICSNVPGGDYMISSSALSNCFVYHNSGRALIYASTVVNSTIIRNESKPTSYGVCNSTMRNCICLYNTPTNHTSLVSASSHNCSWPPAGSAGTTNDPMFIGELDPRLLPGSSCINAGTNVSGLAQTLDLAGNPRVIGGTVDIGAYEFTGGATASGIPWQWLLDYDLETDGTADGEDVDGDGQTAYAEQRAGTHPLDPFSALGMGAAAAADLGDGIFPIFRWSSVSGRVYRVGLSTNLSIGFDAIVADDLPATPPENTVTDRTDAAASFKVYRVEVK